MDNFYNDDSVYETLFGKILTSTPKKTIVDFDFTIYENNNTIDINESPSFIFCDYSKSFSNFDSTDRNNKSKFYTTEEELAHLDKSTNENRSYLPSYTFYENLNYFNSENDSKSAKRRLEYSLEEKQSFGDDKKKKIKIDQTIVINDTIYLD
ncbi:unnamed protein product [Brachionus calyciflorus]|uniref:Uncharacterized protein n=1 Tax=Brachionus calyciflorus TaxID=104777 RepID=A0A813TSL9_9BILA|nr:unnamed protein product [Brachionus calyciflorus]